MLMLTGKKKLKMKRRKMKNVGKKNIKQEPMTGPLGSKGFGSIEEKTEKKECEAKKGGEGIL